MEKLKLNKNTKEYKQLESILNYEVLGMRAKLLQKTINETNETIKKIDEAGEEKEKNKLLKHLENLKKDLFLYWYSFSSFDLIYELLLNKNLHNTLYDTAKTEGLQQAFDFHPCEIEKLKY